MSKIVNCQLKITDIQGKTTIDDLDVEVKPYTVIFNIKDKDNNHLANFQFLPGDGSDWQQKNSPFTWEYNWKSSNYDVIFDKVGFQTQHVVVEISDHTENVTLNILGAVSPSEVADAIWDELRAGHVISGSFGEAIQEELTNIKSETDKIQPEIINKKSQYKADVSKLDTIETLIKRILGLSQENYKLEDIVYVSGQLQTAKIKVYTDSNFSTLLAQYQIICQFNADGTYKSYSVKRI